MKKYALAILLMGAVAAAYPQAPSGALRSTITNQYKTVSNTGNHPNEVPQTEKVKNWDRVDKDEVRPWVIDMVRIIFFLKGFTYMR